MDVDVDLPTVATLLSGVGATTWATMEFADFNIVTELLGSSPELGYAAIGAAGLVTVTDRLGFTEVLD